MTRPPLPLLLLVWTLCGLALVAPARAEEEAPDEVPPPSAEAGDPEPAEEEEEPRAFDPLTFLLRLRDQIAAYEVPPDRSGELRVIRDAWTSILKPRAARMRGRVDRVAKRRRWVFDEAGVLQHLDPDEWKTVIREMASLYTELAGSLAQYESVALKYRPASGGPGGPPSGRSLQAAIAGLRAQERELARRRRMGGIIWLDELEWYWAQVRSVENAQIRYEQKLREWELAVQAYEDLQARVHGELDGKRQALEFQLLSVRTLVAALQAAEEERLVQRVRLLPDDVQPEAAPHLEALRAARLEAESHQDEAAAYGSILRKHWLRARSALVSWIKRAERAQARAAAEAAEDTE